MDFTACESFVCLTFFSDNSKLKNKLWWTNLHDIEFIREMKKVFDLLLLLKSEVRDGFSLGHLEVEKVFPLENLST